MMSRVEHVPFNGRGLRDNKLLCRAERTLSLPSEEQEEVQDCKSRSSDLLGVRTIAAILSAGKSNCKKVLHHVYTH
jgi:hypothetical protein